MDDSGSLFFVATQAFSSSEMTATKSRLNQLQDLQSQVDDTWRSCRWIMDVVAFARDKQSAGIPLSALWSRIPPGDSAEDLEELPDSPVTKTVPAICLSSVPNQTPPSEQPLHPVSRRASRDDSDILLTSTGQSTLAPHFRHGICPSTSTYSLLDVYRERSATQCNEPTHSNEQHQSHHHTHHHHQISTVSTATKYLMSPPGIIN